MPEESMQQLPQATDGWRHLWGFTLDPFRTLRRPTREVRVGDVGIGGSNPIRIQSMTIADTLDTESLLAEIEALHAAGSEIVRVTAPNRSSAENLKNIRERLRQRGVRVPLVADIHFTPQAALIAAQYVEKVRINPGNYADRKHFEKREYSDAEYEEELHRLEEAFRPLVLRCKELGVAMRIGTNHGSLSDRIMNRYGDTPLGMVESALEFVRICEQHGYRDLVLSMKASDVKVMIAAYRLLAARMRELGMDYPFHLGVTEAGSGLAARVKSAIGIVALLEDGIGDTVRVSLTEDSVHEIPVARALGAPFHARHPDADGEEDQRAPELHERVPPWDPYRFNRRSVAAVGGGPARLGSDQPPRIEILEMLPRGISAAEARPWLRHRLENESAHPGLDLLLLRCASLEATSSVPETLAAEARARDPRRAPALGLEIPAAFLAEASLRAALEGWQRLSLRIEAAEIAESAAPWERHLEHLPPLQYTLFLPQPEPRMLRLAAARVAQRFVSGRWPLGGLALEFASPLPAPGPQPWRQFLAEWGTAIAPPLVLRAARLDPEPRIDAHAGADALRVASALGSLLADGIGDAVQLPAMPDPAAARQLAAEILQATRLRLTKADFIACPSCGRTQFDLQSTAARIESKLSHLKGLKIAIMGCIVNGPGEMADADFGYVGSGPGKIDLYVGKERVERSVPQAEADARLIDLIRRHGRWVDPGSDG